MWPAIINILRTVGTLSTGYFFNDAATWIANVTGTGKSVVNTKGTGFAWWYIVLVGVILASVVYLYINFLIGILPAGAKRKSK